MLALVLSGGGTKGLAHIGVLKAFEEQGIVPDVIVGCSIGALIGSMYAAGKNATYMMETAHKIELYKMLDPTFSKLGFMKGEKIIDMLKAIVPVSEFEQLKIPLYINAFDIDKEKEKIFSRGDLLSAVRASISVPGVFIPEKIGKARYIDGGIVSNVPFHAVDADAYIIVDVMKHKPKKNDTAYEILFNSILYTQEALAKEQLKSLTKPYVMVSPDTADFSFLDPTSKHYDAIIKKGYLETKTLHSKLHKFFAMYGSSSS